MFLSQLFIYPIKSAKGMAVPAMALDRCGPLADRRWMVVDEKGHFLSQRTLPRLVLIEPRPAGTDLVVTAPGMPTLTVAAWTGEGDEVPVRLWQDTLTLPHPRPAYDEWFSTFLGRKCRLVYLPDSVTRPVEPPFDDSRWQVSLADGYPLLVTTQAALDLLNTKLAAPISMERFRPNLVITGTAPHAEDGWERLQIGSAELAVVKPCARCSTVLVHPQTAQTGVEPLRTLATYRRRPQQVTFGQNALIITPGVLRVGDSVTTSSGLPAEQVMEKSRRAE